MPLGTSNLEVHTVQLPWGACTYLLRRSKRKSIGFVISDDGLQVSAPPRVSVSEIQGIVASKSDWIERSLQRWRERQSSSITLEELLLNKKPVPVRGQPFEVRVVPTGRPLLNPWTQEITLPQSQSTSLKSLEKLLKNHAREVFVHMANTLASKHALPAFQIRISSPRMRWGSCNSKGEVRLNWRLVHYPLHMIEYVIAHELAHLVEMNHSPRFWAIVEQLMPNYRERHKALAKLNPAEVPKL